MLAEDKLYVERRRTLKRLYFFFPLFALLLLLRFVFLLSLSLSPFLFVLHEIVEGSVRIYLFKAQEPEEHLKHA